MKKLIFGCGILSLVLTTSAAILKSGDSVAFLGDSITAWGWTGWWAGGYVKMCEAGFRANDLKVTIYPVGRGGDKSDQMLARLGKDVISKKPTWMTLSCGVNDVMHQEHKNGVYVKGGNLLPAYKENITKIIDTAQAAGIKVVILTATMITENADDFRNKLLLDYNAFLQTLAKEKGCPLVDVSTEMRRQVADFRAKTGCTDHFLTNDGVHMDYLGNLMMARKLLKDGFAFTDAEMAKAEEGILTKVPAYLPVSSVRLTGADYLKVTEEAIKNKKTPPNYARPILTEAAQQATPKLLGN